MQRIIHLLAIVNRLLDVLNYIAKVMKSHILTMNAPTRIVVPEGQVKMDQNGLRVKHGRLIGSKDTTPRKQKGRTQEFTLEKAWY